MTQRGEEGDLSRLRNLIVARLRDCPPFLSTNRPMVSLIARPYPDQLFTPKRPAKFIARAEEEEPTLPFLLRNIGIEVRLDVGWRRVESQFREKCFQTSQR